MPGSFYMGGLLIATAIVLLLTLLAGDVRRRRITARRKWYEGRVHTALDRVQALKLEMEPPIDGIGSFAHVEVRARAEPGDGGENTAEAAARASGSHPEPADDVTPPDPAAERAVPLT